MRIFTATPNAFLQAGAPDCVFFARDMGLTCYALREFGVDSSVVALESESTKKHPDIIRVSIDNMEDASWWKRHNLDGVVLGGGVGPHHCRIAKAIKQSGAKLVVRCDSGLAYSQWQKTVWASFYDNYLRAHYKEKSSLYGWLYSMAVTPYSYLSDFREKKVVSYKSQADLILSETPEGVRLLKNLFCRYGMKDVAARVKYVPHPIAQNIDYPGQLDKRRRIVSVGRWGSYLKNAPMLMRVLQKVLKDHSGYEAHLFGGGEEELRNLMELMPDGIRRRIFVRGKVPNSELYSEYLKGRIFLAPSRADGFNIAGAEALCCGCSFVGSGHILSFRNFVSRNSGTVSRRYSVRAMSEALAAEIHAWEKGLRNPKKSSAQWAAEVNRQVVAEEVMKIVEGEPTN